LNYSTFRRDISAFHVHVHDNGTEWFVYIHDDENCETCKKDCDCNKKNKHNHTCTHTQLNEISRVRTDLGDSFERDIRVQRSRDIAV
jgi:hypothetical protein